MYNLFILFAIERAMAHCNSNEVLIVGGVGCKFGVSVLCQWLLTRFQL